MYKDSDSLGKLVILLLVNHKRYNKEEIDHACKLEAENSGFSFRKSKKQKTHCDSQEKIEHFLEFLFSSGLLEDVALCKIKFGSGEKQNIANAI